MRYSIGDFSRITRMSVKTLRYYHEEGLLVPEQIDPDSGYRYYSDSLLPQARLIQDLRSLEFPLKTVKAILEHQGDDGEVLELINAQALEVERRIARYQKIRRRLQDALEQEKRPSSVPVNLGTLIEKDVKPITVASIRYQGTYESIGETLQILFRVCGRLIVGAPLTLHYDAEYKDADADMEVAVPVRKAVENGEVRSRMLEGGRVLSLVHRGPYETIGHSYQTIIDAINDRRLTSLPPSREIYLKGPGLIVPGNPKRYLTEIQMMLG